MEKDKWINMSLISESDFSDNIYCDTRDFAVFTCDNEFNSDVVIPHDETCVFEKDEILPFLKSLRNKLIENDCYFHRINVMRYNIPKDSNHYRGWVKYIRFMKQNGKYIMYTTFSDNLYALSKTYINPDNIIIKN